MQLLILSDIHGNVSALNNVLADAFERYDPDAVALLGDLIDYGMRSNEVIEIIKDINIPILCNLWGNHERAIVFGDYSCFSSERGVLCAQNTRKNLSEKSFDYLENMTDTCGYKEFIFDGSSFESNIIILLSN